MTKPVTLTDRVLLLPYNEDGTISRQAVLEIVKDAVPVEIDPTMFDAEKMDTPGDETGLKTLAVVSTAYNLLADTAAEFAANDQRKALGGENSPSDAEIFADPSSGFESYRDLAVREEAFLLALSDVFDKILKETEHRAKVASLIFNLVHGFKAGE